ncbi:permease prefix domain 1-containing protein [Actinoplanes sp. GCM10030250]|uniref:permease prefix domain 1-containing protein n=1 Tax=Actinoplanes sp. GCM10030250 TaxID=3273376 RepID=UPI00360E4430
MTTLIDRYVYTVLRRVPEQQRTDIERELRTSIDDAIEARTDSGEAHDPAVTATLLELGDPDRLADGYADRTQFLIGPQLYPAWRRLLTMLLSIVLPVVVIILATVDAIESESIGTVIGGVVTNILTIGVNMAFWVTAVFALLERTGVAAPSMRDRPWTPDDLPRYESNFMTVSQLAAGIIWPVLLIAALVLQQFTFTDVPTLDPANWTFWWPYLIVVLALEALYMVWLYRQGGWSHKATVVNGVLGLLYVVPVVWLLATEQFFNPEFIAGLEWGTVEPLSWLTGIVITVVVIAQAWDFVEVAVRAERARRGLPTQVPGTGREFTSPVG